MHSLCFHCLASIHRWFKVSLQQLPSHEYSSWLQIPTRSRDVVHLIFSLFVPSSNRSLLSQKLTAVSDKSPPFVSRFFVSNRFSWHVVAVSKYTLYCKTLHWNIQKMVLMNYGFRKRQLINFTPTLDTILRSCNRLYVILKK